MIKTNFLFLALLLLLMPINSAYFVLENEDEGSVIISELGNPAKFALKINNPLNLTDRAEIYSFVGISFSPRGSFDVYPGENIVRISVTPDSKALNPGRYNFEYEIKGNLNGITKDTLNVKVVEMKEVISFSSRDLNIGDKEAYLVFKNNENTFLEDIPVYLKSVFFEETEKISLAPYEEKVIKLDVENSNSIVSGAYIVNAEISHGKSKTELESVINYLPEEEVTLTKTSEGFVIKETTITKTNIGNTKILTDITLRKDIFTRLFTTYSNEPLISERNGLFVDYTWQKNLSPGESFNVKVKTNYTFPFILLFLIIVSILMVYFYTSRKVSLKKEVHFVKTKGGEFALKVTLRVKAKSHLDKLQIIDVLPGVAKLYEKFGSKPDRIDLSTRRMIWNIERLQPGEERVFSYIMYSKVKIVGRFELPSATIIYEKDGKSHEDFSNRAFFLAETGAID